MTYTNHTAATEAGLFPQKVTGDPPATLMAVVEGADGDAASMGIAPGRNEIPTRMLAGSGSMPVPARAAEAAR